MKLIILMMGLLMFFVSQAVGNNTLPPEFGNIVPLFEWAELINTRITRDTVQVDFRTKALQTEVMAFYRQRLPDHGWRLAHATDHDMVLRGAVRSKKSDIHLTLQCNKPNRDKLTLFSIKLEYIKGRE